MNESNSTTYPGTWGYDDEVITTVTERTYDQKGNLVKEVVTETRKRPRLTTNPPYRYPYPYTVTYRSGGQIGPSDGYILT